MPKFKGNFEKTNAKTRLNYSLGIDKCINPDKCVCIFCKRKREEKKSEQKRLSTTSKDYNGGDGI